MRIRIQGRRVLTPDSVSFATVSATACGRVYQVNILVACSPSKEKEDSQHNRGVPIVWPVLVHLRVIVVYQLAVRAKHKGGTRANPDD